MERRLPNSSVVRYVITPTYCPSTFTRHTFPTLKMYSCTVLLIDVGSAVTRYGNTHQNYTDTSARVRGVYVESILVACTTRPRQCSNVRTTRTFESPNCCATTRTAPRLILSVGLTPHNCVTSHKKRSKTLTRMCWNNSQKHKRTRTNGSTLHDHPRMVTQHDHSRMVMTPMTRNLDHRPIHTKR